MSDSEFSAIVATLSKPTLEKADLAALKAHHGVSAVTDEHDRNILTVAFAPNAGLSEKNVATAMKSQEFKLETISPPPAKAGEAAKPLPYTHYHVYTVGSESLSFAFDKQHANRLVHIVRK